MKKILSPYDPDDDIPFMDADSDDEDDVLAPTSSYVNEPPSPALNNHLSDKGGGNDMDPLIPTEEPETKPPALEMVNVKDDDDDPSVQLVKAVKNDASHIIDDLLEKSSAPHMYTALLFSITMGRDHITKMFVEHPKYETLHEMARMSRLGKLDIDTAVLEDQAPEGEEVESDITPIMLASLRNQYEIVLSLMSKGETIDEPHSLGCTCPDCRAQTDKHREAKTRLNAYKALCSDAYILLASEDPIYRAFELGQKLRKLAQQEKHYKAEYLQLAESCADFSGTILDRVRDGQELDTLLNEKSGSGLTTYGNLARLKLAVRYREKKFVAHPACQKKLSSLWMGTMNPGWVDGTARMFFFVICLTIAYPFLVLAYWVNPRNKLAEFLQIPIVKFVASTISYVVFIGLLVGFSTTEQVSAGYTLSEHPRLGTLYAEYLQYTPYKAIEDVGIRVHQIRPTTVIIVIWIAGMVWENIKKIISEKMTFFTDNMYNLINFILLSLYVTAFSFRFHSFTMVQISISYFSYKDSWIALANNDTEAVSKLYWMSADRNSWSAVDPIVLSEAVMSIASILTICKLTYVFTLSERIGPLVLSLMKMIEDVLAFMVLFIFIIAAFCVGFHNLYWYFYSDPPEGETVLGRRRHSSFTSIGRIIELFFWSIFGLVEMEQDKFHTTERSEVTAVTGHVLFAMYNWIMVIILINMLIAMMSRSYEIIAEFEDIEWKFARTKLFLEYMREGNTLATPFNLVPTFKGCRLLHEKCQNANGSKGRCGCCRVGGRRKASLEVEAIPNNANNSNNNGDEVEVKKSNGFMTNFTHTSSKAVKEKPGPQYKFVMGEIIKRITSKGGSADDEPDPLEMLQQDMSSMRQEVITTLFRQDRDREAMAAKIEADMLISRDQFTTQNQHLETEHAKRLLELKDTMDYLDTHIKTIQDAMTLCLMDVQKHMTSQITDTRSQMEDNMDGVKTGMASINVEFQDLVRKQIEDTRREMEKHMKDMKEAMIEMNKTFQKHVTEQIQETRKQMNEHMTGMKSEMEVMNRDFQGNMSQHIDNTRKQTLEHMEEVKHVMDEISEGLSIQSSNVDKIETAILQQAETVTMVNDRLILLCQDITTIQEHLEKSMPQPPEIKIDGAGRGRGAVRRSSIPIRSSSSVSPARRGTSLPTRVSVPPPFALNPPEVAPPTPSPPVTLRSSIGVKTLSQRFSAKPEPKPSRQDRAPSPRPGGSGYSSRRSSAGSQKDDKSPTHLRAPWTS